MKKCFLKKKETWLFLETVMETGGVLQFEMRHGDINSRQDVFFLNQTCYMVLKSISDMNSKWSSLSKWPKTAVVYH